MPRPHLDVGPADAGVRRAREPGTARPLASSLFDRIRGRAELVLGPIELHAHQLLSRPLTPTEVDDARSAAHAMVRGLGDLQMHNLAQLARGLVVLLEQEPKVTTGIEIAGTVEDIRTMLASAIAQVECSPALSGTVLAVGEPTAAFDSVLWNLATRGHHVVHADRELVEPPDHPDAVLVSVGDSLDPASHANLRAVREMYSTPTIVFHDGLPFEVLTRLSAYCTTLLPADTAPALVSEEILRLRAAEEVQLTATVWQFPAAVPLLRSHGFEVAVVEDRNDLTNAPFGAVLIGAGVPPAERIDATRLIRASPAARRAPVIWQGPLAEARRIEAARLGVIPVEEFSDADAVRITTELRRFADAEADDARHEAVLEWPAARLLIDRSLVAAQRANTSAAVAVLRIPPRCGEERRRVLHDALVREFRRGDVVGSRSPTYYVVALQGIGHRVALDRLRRLAPRLDPEIRIGVAQFPSDGRSAEDLARAADHAIQRAATADGPRVVSTVWRPAAAAATDLLIVDSDLVLGEMLASTLSDHGISTRVMSDGHDALVSLTTSAPEELPKVLMIDLDFGGADGRSLLAALEPAGLLAHMKILVMASRAAENDIRIALDLGASEVIRKPFPVSLLQHRLVGLLGE